VYLGFTTQAFVFLAIAGLLYLASIYEAWLPHVKALRKVMTGRRRPGTTVDGLKTLTKQVGEAAGQETHRALSTSALRGDSTIYDALSDLVSRAFALEHYQVSYHPITVFDASPAELWERDYALWEDSAIALLKRIDRAATADVLRSTTAPRHGIYASATLVPIGVEQAKVSRLRGQREVLEKVKAEYSS
jgi:hypothetical protein